MAGRKSEASRASAKVARPVRERLAEDLESRYETLLKVLEDGMEAKKRARGWCETCGKAVYVEIQDTGAALKAAEFFSNQGLGRPGEDRSQGDSGGFVVHRHVVEP